MGLSHAAILNVNPKVELVAVIGTSSFVLDALKSLHQLTAYRLRKMLLNEELDSAIVSTPTKFITNLSMNPLVKISALSVKTFQLKPGTLRGNGKSIQYQVIITHLGFRNRFLVLLRN